MYGAEKTYAAFLRALNYIADKGGHGFQKVLAADTKKSAPYINQVINQKTKASFDSQVTIAEAAGFAYEEFLAFGRRLLDVAADDPIASPNNSTILFKIDDIPNPECQFVEKFSDLPPGRRPFNKDFIAVPVLTPEVVAGQPIIFRKNIEGWAIMHVPGQKGKDNLVAMRVKEGAMEPTIREGSIVCIDCDQRDIQPGKIFAVARNNEAVIKRVYKEGSVLQLISDNSDREFRQPLFVDLKKLDHNPVIGKVVWAWVDFENDE